MDRTVVTQNDLRVVQSARSFLFVPGDRPERFAKAVASSADVVVLDLEDAVAPERKDFALSAVVEWLSNGGRGCVRLDHTRSPGNRAAAAALTGVTGLISVMIPKAEDGADLTAAAEQLGVPVIALIESAVGMVRAQSLADSEGVARLAFGHLDYALDLDADPGWMAMLSARASLVLASRAARLPGPIDGVTTALDNPETLEQDLMSARDLGMTAKLLVHPRQVSATQAAFQPDPEAIRWARRVVEASARNEAVRVDGHMVDAPVLARARALLEKLV